MDAICAVVITYFPKPSVVDNIRILAAQVDHVLVIDNGSQGDSQDVLRQIAAVQGVSVHRNGANLGIGAALNIGIVLAEEKGYRWLASFDQDSQVTPNMLSMMQAVYVAHPDNKNIAALIPVYQDQASGRVFKFPPFAASPADPQGVVDVLLANTSGSLFHMDIFDMVGRFDEGMFIDYVDYEFCLRTRKRGYRTLQIGDAILLHNLGEPTQRRLLWRTVMVTNHSALRHYYIMRNRLILCKRYLPTFPLWVLKEMYITVIRLVKTMLFEDARLTKLKANLMGFCHGLIGKTGASKDAFK